jgi:hypothetical protein
MDMFINIPLTSNLPFFFCGYHVDIPAIFTMIEVICEIRITMCWWEDNIQMNHNKVRLEGVGWICVSKDRD